MRGLGIVLVVVGHLWRWPDGVFAMLDMFFVLSGFLITAILVKALSKYGPGFLLVFALSRVRRLMPAALTVLTVTVALTYFVYSSARGALVAQDAMWAALLVVNWHFAANGTDYFTDDKLGSPLIHYWSLSIEEQFYAVWPFLILGLLALAARRRAKSPTLTLGIGIGIVVAVTFSYSMWHSVVAPTTAYFSTLDRAWEFGIGGLVAAFSAHLARLPRWAGITMSWGGTLGLLATLYFLPYGVAFPAPYGLFPSVLTAAIIIGGLERETSYIPLLDNRPMIYLGDLSYSIYLVHLPVNVMLRPFFAPGAVGYYIAAVAGTFAAAAACYYLVERPFRSATWLMTKPERVRRDRSGESVNWGRIRDGWLAVATLVVVAAVTLSLTNQTSKPPSDSSRSSGPPIPIAPGDDRSAALREQESAVIAALESETFPEFSPPLGSTTYEDWAADLQADGCTDVTVANIDACAYGSPDSRQLAVVVGDSYAMAWTPGVREALVPRGWRLQQLTLGQCPTWTLPGYVTAENRPHPECQAQHARVDAFVLQTKPDLVILASGAAQVRNSERDDLPDDPLRVAEEGLTATLEALMPHAERIVVLQPWITNGSLTDCVSRFAGPDNCVSSESEYWKQHVAGEMAAAEAVGADYVVTEDWFCYDRSCPAFIGETPVTADGGHISIHMSTQLTPLLRETLIGTRKPRRASPEGLLEGERHELSVRLRSLVY